MDSAAQATKRIISYVYSESLIQQADRNPAVKGRASLTHELIRSYGLCNHMRLLPAKSCSITNLHNFHSRDYVQQLERCGPRCTASGVQQKQLQHAVEFNNSIEMQSDEDFEYIDDEYGLGFDCPTWRGIRNYACAVAGATMSACERLSLNNKSTVQRQHVVINWTGGWHHAQRDKAAGYCYVNDIVLGILMLRKRFQRVLYVDLDVHHGDGVQAAFETTRRVFTLSFHKLECGFYPGTGAASDCGRFTNGRGYSANFAYKDGIKGANFQKYFKRVTSSILTRYQPDVCVIQCGADALAADPLGGTNLTPNDLIACIDLLLQQNLPTLLLGGGGYNFPNASRFWTQLTAHLCGQQLDEDIPTHNPHFLKYGPAYSLHIEAQQFRKDLNTVAHLEKCADIIEDNLKKYRVGAI